MLKLLTRFLKRSQPVEEPKKRDLLTELGAIGLIRLKIKIKSLAAEATFIRQEEIRARKKSISTWYLYQHRIIDVAREQRAALVAYGYIREMGYSEIEDSPRWRLKHSSKPAPKWERVAELVQKYGASRSRFTEEGAFLTTKDIKRALIDDIIKWAKTT